MSWIDDDMAELHRLKETAAELRIREGNIASEAAIIYDDLWSEIVRAVEEAKHKGLSGILVNGGSYQRKIIVPVIPKQDERSTQPKEFIVRLTPDQQAITVKGPGLSVLLTLDLCEDNVVRMKHNGEHKSAKEAAKVVLRPVLFPELFGPK